MRFFNYFILLFQVFCILKLDWFGYLKKNLNFIHWIIISFTFVSNNKIKIHFLIIKLFNN